MRLSSEVLESVEPAKGRILIVSDQIRAESRDGEGSTFTFDVPRSDVMERESGVVMERESGVVMERESGDVMGREAGVAMRRGSDDAGNFADRAAA